MKRIDDVLAVAALALLVAGFVLFGLAGHALAGRPGIYLALGAALVTAGGICAAALILLLGAVTRYGRPDDSH